MKKFLLAATLLATCAMPVHALPAECFDSNLRPKACSSPRPNKPYDDPVVHKEPETKVGEEIKVGNYALPDDHDGYCARIPEIENSSLWYREPQENYGDTRFASVACTREKGKSDCLVMSADYYCTLHDCSNRHGNAYVQTTGTEYFCASNVRGRWFRAPNGAKARNLD